MTTADYLNQLEQDRQDLVDNLETKGITGLSGDETFTELVPEVLNISGGSTPIPTNYYEYEEQLKNISDNFVNYINSVVNNRQVYTNDIITLYTPNIDFKQYVIQKRSSGKYRVVWFNCVWCIHNATTNYQPGLFNSSNDSYTIINNTLTQLLPGIPQPYTAYDLYGYYSNELDTPQDVISGMINNTLTYTKGSTGGYGMVEDTPLIFPFSNTIIWNLIGIGNPYTQIRPTIIETKILSHNETIVAIS